MRIPLKCLSITVLCLAPLVFLSICLCHVPLQDCLSLFDSSSPCSPNKSLAQKKRTLCHFNLFLSMSRNENPLGLNLKTSLRILQIHLQKLLVLLSNMSPSSHQHYCGNVICRRALPTHRTYSFLAPCCPPAKTLYEKSNHPYISNQLQDPMYVGSMHFIHMYTDTCVERE